jgi:hypothetical protein
MSISFLAITASCSVYPDPSDSIRRVRSHLIRNVRTRSGAELLKQGGDLGWRDLDQWALTQRRQDMLDHVTSVVVDIGGRVDELTQPTTRVLFHRDPSRPTRSHQTATGHRQPLGGLRLGRERRRVRLAVHHQASPVAVGRKPVHAHRPLPSTGVDGDVAEGRAFVTSGLWTATATETRNTQFSLPGGPRRPDSVCALGGIRTPGRLIRSRMFLLELSESRRTERIERR